MNMNMNMNMKMTTTVPTEGGRLHLLLHCVDGCVPYLNPSQLEKHFPPSETPDLWLGLAVRDSCVAPVYGEAAGKKQRKNNPPKPKAKAKLSDDGTTATTATVTTTTTAEKGGTNGTKIRGYTFREASPDPWLLPYTRFTVPSFDLRDESTGKTSKNTNNAISVSTPHGKQKLTPDLYVTASLEGLRSHHTVSLFDDVDDNEFSRKRKVKAVTRNHQWFRHLAAAAAAKTSETNGEEEEEASPSGSLLWKPILLPHETETASQNPGEGRGERTDDERADHNPSGLAFVGRWHSGVQLGELLRNGNATPGSSASASATASVTASVTSTATTTTATTASTSTESIPWKAVLATRSLRDIVEIASTGLINVIGTDLPRKWAKEKLALGLDLAPRGDTASTAASTAAGAGTTGGDTKGDTTSDARTTVDERESKRQKVVEESAPLSSVSLSSSSSSSDAPTAATARKHTALNADGCLDLSDVSFARDPKPLVEGCACFVCRDARFSRAYIHHLVVAKEMVAEILFFGHNLHCLLQLLRAFDSGDPSRGNAVKELVFGQLPL